MPGGVGVGVGSGIDGEESKGPALAKPEVEVRTGGTSRDGDSSAGDG